MGFLGIYRAVYEYTPQSEGELSIREGDLLCVLEKSKDDDWWRAKKKASADEEDEPIGLVPNNYVEEAKPVGQARSLYEYTRQTDEELSFPEDAPLRVYDVSDPDWILVGYESDFGFVPANYIEINDAGTRQEPETDTAPTSIPSPAAPPTPVALPAPPAPPSLPVRPIAPVEPDEPRSPPLPERPATTDAPATSDPAATLAQVMQSRSSTRAPTPPPITIAPRQPRPYVEEPEDERSPPLPVRPRSHSTVASEQYRPSPAPPQRISSLYTDDRDAPSGQFSPLAPGGFHMYNINEMVSVSGKKRKMPTTLGINLKTGIILIAPEKAQDGPTQEWSAEKMTHYSREGKHVFLELVRPSKSIDFHAGAKDTAEEIVSALGELSGAMKAEGLREIVAAGSGRGAQKRGQILYDFTAQGDDEVTVDVGDDIIILDDTKSDEWWQVRRVKNGKEGVVPSSYVERTDTIIPQATAGVKVGLSSVAQNRQEEARLAREAVKKEPKPAEPRTKRENGSTDTGRSGSSKSKPDPSKVRVWTDRSKSFSVEAQFLGFKDGKINLHKLNGVKIAVPLAKMSSEDIQYVERAAGISLDEDKPLADLKRESSMRANNNKAPPSSSNIGASVEPAKPTYDWFQFFLSCDVAVGLCERYKQAFVRDSMDESVLPDVDATILRNLGLREGDIIKVMRFLDKKFRDGKNKAAGGAGEADAGGLFSGPGGALRNNTRKGRPVPPVQASDVVDGKILSQQNEGDAKQSSTSLPEGSRSEAPNKPNSGFDDDAWDVKPAKQAEAQSKPAPNPEPKAAPVQPQPTPTQAMQDLSLLATPLEPTKVEPQIPPQQTPTPPLSQSSQIAAQPLGATPTFFSEITATHTGAGTSATPLNLGLGTRQRPTPPLAMNGQGVLMPPPPARPLSAPQSAQPSVFAPPMPALQSQITGIAPPGHSLNELNQQRFQQAYMGNFQQATGPGFMPTHPGFLPQQFIPQMTGPSQMQQFPPIPAQTTGYPVNYQAPQQFPQQTGINTFLSQPMEPQRMSMVSPSQLQSQQTGLGSFGTGFNPASNGALQPPPMAPLQPQKTGPAPPVRFGVTNNKLAPQATGRRANLSQATPENPFGF